VNESDSVDREGRPGLGGTPEPRVQRYFCVQDAGCQAFARVSKDAKVLRREPKVVVVMGQEVKGWIVEQEVPATDGTVRIDPLSDTALGRSD